MNKIIKLPENFLISAKIYGKNPLWEKYIDWLNEKYSSMFDGGNTSAYYGIHNNNPTCILKDDAIYSKIPRISIYEWYASINSVPDFTVKGTKLGDCSGLSFCTFNNQNFKAFDSLSTDIDMYSKGIINIDNQICIMLETEDFTSANPFVIKLSDLIKRYKEQSNMEEKKKLLGYKIKKEYIEAYMKLFDKSPDKESYLNENISFYIGSLNYNKASKYGILYTWFDEVYEEEPVLPEINGYAGKYDKDKNTIKYGCAIFPFTYLKTIYVNITSFNRLVTANKDKYNRTITYVELSSGVKVSIDELKSIVEYVENVNEIIQW